MVSKGLSIAVILFCASWFFSTPTSGQTQPKTSVKRSELFRPLPLTKFYDTPDPLPPGKPGDLIRSAEFDEYYLPAEVNAIRFLYHSRTAADGDVAVSGVVLFPDRTPPAGGWPVIAWAHSWTGVGRSCAPSLTRNLQHGPFLAMYVHLGYAVVATDYAGLGTAFRSAYADAPSNARDVIYSVAAAHHALPQLGARWIAMGTGEGGTAVVKLAELENSIHDPNYLGSVAISRLGDLQDVYASESALGDKLALFLAYGVKTAYPQFNAKDILAPEAISAYQQIGQECTANADQPREKPSASAMLKPGWENNPFVQKYFERNRIGTRPASAPLLVIGSEGDPTLAETSRTVDRLCKQGDRAEFAKYEGSDPGRVIGDSARDQMSWIQSRFAGTPPRSNCSSQH
jgi:hypothetical protein